MSPARSHQPYVHTLRDNVNIHLTIYTIQLTTNKTSRKLAPEKFRIPLVVYNRVDVTDYTSIIDREYLLS